MRFFLLAVYVVVSCLLIPSHASSQPLSVLASHYFADEPFPEFAHLWHEGFALQQGQDYSPRRDALGGYLFVHFQNLSSKTITIEDLIIDGVKLSEGLGKSSDACGELYGHSIKLSKLPGSEIQKLKSAGEPVWWKVEPSSIAPKGLGQIVLRLRKQPEKESLTIEAIAESYKVFSAVVSTRKADPGFVGVYFTPELNTIYAYIRHPKGAKKPDRLYLDGKNISSVAEVGFDPAVDIIPVKITLPKPLEPMSYHCLRAGFPDGTAATAGIRAWGDEFVYGIWGSRGDARSAYIDWAIHNFNVHMGHGDKATMEMSLDPEGFKFLQSLGFRNMATWYGNARNPIFYFLLDEPDAQDYGIDDLPPTERLGLLGQALVHKAEELRKLDAKTPILLNINGTYKPENWYTYHQLADIACIDPYYQGELDLTYIKRPGRYFAFTKPTYVLAATKISQSTCQPKPLHVILCSTRYIDPKAKQGDYTGRYPTPEEKRLEAYYALGAGAKGISYWWFTPAGDCLGMGSDEPAAKALYQSVGILGAELRTAGPIITTSCPAKLDITTPRLVAARPLVRGLDTIIITITNENVLCDRAGTIYKPAENVKIKLRLPEWMKPADSFEITADGIRDISWQRNGKEVEFDLGTVDLTRLVVLSSDPTLRVELQKLYESKFAANVKKLKNAGSNYQER